MLIGLSELRALSWAGIDTQVGFLLQEARSKVKTLWADGAGGIGDGWKMGVVNEEIEMGSKGIGPGALRGSRKDLRVCVLCR